MTDLAALQEEKAARQEGPASPRGRTAIIQKALGRKLSILSTTQVVVVG
jgi:hypothetical protein